MGEPVREPAGRPRRARRRRRRAEPAVPPTPGEVVVPGRQVGPAAIGPDEVVVPGRPVGPGEVAVPSGVVEDERRAFIDVPRRVEEDVVERPRRRPFNLGPLAVFAVAFVFLLAAAVSVAATQVTSSRVAPWLSMAYSVAAVVCTLTAMLMAP